MGIQRSREDSWTREMAKWEMRPVLVGDTYIEPIPFAQGGKGGAPHQEYPKMLYRGESADGGPRIADAKVVDSEAAERIALGHGWSIKPQDALDAVFRQQREFAELAANRAHQEKWMSGKAREEAALVDESTMAHLPVIPETPIRRKAGRPRKQSEAAPAVEG